ncbi:MAG: NAD(P)H-hydrate dehydratase [Thermomicrobiales bacterium]|nr:NAD(P)H-hydrate dehydratase [Thermomicrobiales bacterium]
MTRTADEAFALQTLPRRAPGAHKWGVGGVVVVAGGPGYIGAAALTAMGAGRAGAGIVNVAVPRGAMGTIAALVPEAAFIPLPEGSIESSARRVHEALSPKLAKFRAVVVGPGLGEDEYADSLLGVLFGRRSTRRPAGVGFRHRSDADVPVGDDDRGALVGADVPAVIDADALNWLAKQEDWAANVRAGSLVLTPHVGEMSRLTGRTSDDILSDPVAAALDAAAEWRQVVVLKHGRTIATDGSTVIDVGDVPPSLATAGSGDILAGVIGAFLAQSVAPLDAAGLALYIGIRAAKRVERTYGTLGLVASDLAPALAEEIAALERKRDE